MKKAMTISYEVGNNLYINLTNKCPCACTFCLRQNGDTYADDIAAALDMDLSALLSALTLLELDGFVESLFGKQYRAV